MGGQAGLRPTYDQLIAEINKFGSDVELPPKKAYVSIRRNEQFAITRSSTKTRVDVGINSKLLDVTPVLEASSSFNSMVIHRVRLETPKDVKQELIKWLKSAYQES